MSTVQPFPLGPTYGAELLATFVSVALWGTTCMQTLLYFINYQNDKTALKALVIWLWVVDTIHESLIVQGVYMSLITYFCDYGRVKSVVPEFLWQVFLTSLVALPSQFFFTYRVSKFSGKRWLFLVLLAPAAAFELVGGLAFIALGTITPTTEALVSFTPASVFTAVQGTAAAVDIANAAGLVYLLSQNWGGALPKSRNILQSLVILTINTGIWTALFAIFTLITIVVYKGDLIYAALYFPLCPLYCNTVLANLNARTFISSHPGFGDGDTLNPGLVFVQPGRTSTVVQPGIGVIDPTLATSEGSSEDTRNEYHVDRPFLTAESDRGESQEIGRDSPM